MTLNTDVIRESKGLHYSVTTYATANLADFIDGVEGGPQQALVRVFGELCFAALLIASLVESVVRLALTLISIPVCILTCDDDFILSSWLAEGALISLGNAFCIATDVLVQNICLQKLALYGPEVIASRTGDLNGYALNLGAMRNPNVLEVPTINTSMDVLAEFNTWIGVLDTKYHLLNNVDDDGYSRDWSTVKERWDVVLPPYFQGNSARQVRYVNILRHLAVYIQKGWQQHVEPLSPEDRDMIKLHFTRPDKAKGTKATPRPLLAATALSTNQRNAANVLRNAAQIIRVMGGSFFHCVNRQGTALQELYRTFVANDRSALERESLGFAMRTVLAELRDRIFIEALTYIKGGDPASTDNYYRRELGTKYGVTADISQYDTAHEHCARQGEEAVFESLFDREYTIPKIIQFLQKRLSSKGETVFTSKRFSGEWIVRGYRGDRDTVMDGDLYSEEVIFAFLAHERIIVRRQ